MTDEQDTSRRGFLAATAGFLTGGLVGAGLGKMNVEGKRYLAEPVNQPPRRRQLTEADREAENSRYMIQSVRYENGHVAEDQAKPPEAEQSEQAARPLTARECGVIAEATGAGAVTGTVVTVTGKLVQSAFAKELSS
jgi:hypothetical protein